MAYTEQQVAGTIEEYERYFDQGEVVLAAQTAETLRSMIGLQRADAILDEVRRRLGPPSE